MLSAVRAHVTVGGRPTRLGVPMVTGAHSHTHGLSFTLKPQPMVAASRPGRVGAGRRGRSRCCRCSCFKTGVRRSRDHTATQFLQFEVRHRRCLRLTLSSEWYIPVVQQHNNHTQPHTTTQNTQQNTTTNNKQQTVAILAQVPRPSAKVVFIASRSSQSGCVNFCLYTDMPFKAGKPPRSPHDWLCRFCVTSSGNPYRNNGFRRECHRCHLAKGEAFEARSEKREPPAKSTKELAKVAALEKELERYRQAEKKSDESAQQETDAPTKAAYKMAIKAFGQLQTAGCSPTTTRRSRRSKQSWTRQRLPVTSPSSKGGYGHAGGFKGKCYWCEKMECSSSACSKKTAYLSGKCKNSIHQAEKTTRMKQTKHDEQTHNGVRLSKCPKIHAGTVSRWFKISLRSGVLRGCVKTQTSSGSVQRSSTSISWGMIRLHEPSSVRGFVNGARRFGHSWEEGPPPSAVSTEFSSLRRTSTGRCHC